MVNSPLGKYCIPPPPDPRVNGNLPERPGGERQMSRSSKRWQIRSQFRIPLCSQYAADSRQEGGRFPETSSSVRTSNDRPDCERKFYPSSFRATANELRRRRRLRIRHALLLDGLYSLHQVVGHADIGVAGLGGRLHIGLLAVEKVEVGHGVVVVRPEINGLLELIHALVHDGAILVGEILGKR